MRVEDIFKIELEVTSKCNARCPNCSRTLFPSSYVEKSISLDEIKNILPGRRYLDGKLITLCGQLGDPMMHPDIFDICEYLIDNGASVLINTNGGLRSTDLWKRLGQLSYKTQGSLRIWFCVDGHAKTNSIYRVNTAFDTIIKNLEAYRSENGYCEWHLITFDHNVSERELCRAKARELGIPFNLRTPSEPNNVNDDGVSFKIEPYDPTAIVCKPIHNYEILISYDMKVLPCCFMYGVLIGRDKILKKAFDGYEDNWNSLVHHTLDEILEHDYYTKDLEKSWNIDDNRNVQICSGCVGKKDNFNRMVDNMINISKDTK